MFGPHTFPHTVTLDTAGLTLFRLLLIPGLCAGISSGISEDCQGQFNPPQVFSLQASWNVIILYLGWAMPVPGRGWSKTYCHPVGGSEWARVSLLQQELIQKSLGVFGSILTFRCQGSVGVFSLALEMELVPPPAWLAPPKAFPPKFRRTFQDLRVPNASCPCPSQWNDFSPFSVLGQLTALIHGIPAIDCVQEWRTTRTKAEASCHRGAKEAT